MSELKLLSRTATATAGALLVVAATYHAPASAAAASIPADDTVSSREVAAALAGTPDDLLVPTDAARGDRDSAAEVAGDGVAVDVPRDPEAGVTLGSVDSPVTVGIPQADEAGRGVALAGGAVAYPGTDGSATAVLPAAGGAATQFTTVIADPGASERYAYPVEVPAGARLTLTGDGGAEVVDADGQVLLAVPAPWAKAADGGSVPTRFELSPDATELVQVVDHQGLGSASYPVVADPIWFAVSAAVFWWAVSRCGAGGSIGAVFAYVGGERSRRALAAAGAAGCLSSFVGGWGILRNLVRVIRY